MRTIKIFILCFTLNIVGGMANADENDWVFVENNQGVTIHSRKLAEYAESEFRGTRILEYPVEVIAAVLADIQSYPLWFFNCISASKIPDTTSTNLNFLIYIVVKTPWPLWNRDVIYTTETRIDMSAGKITVWGKAVQDTKVPIKQNHVRVTDSALKWVLARIDDNRTRISFTKRINAGGSIGSYLSDLGCRKTIFESLVNLSGIAADPKYAALGNRLKEEYGKDK